MAYQALQHRAKMGTVATPAAHRTGIQRLANLPEARRRDRPIRFVEFQASGIPVKAQEGDKTAAFGFQVRDQRLVMNFQDRARKDRSPMIGHTFDFDGPCRALLQIA